MLINFFLRSTKYLILSYTIQKQKGPVSGGLLPGVIRNCMNKIHLHIFALSHGNSLFKRADGFFKQDQTGKVWFLWNNCYRIQLKNYYGQKNYVSNNFFSSKLNMRPLSLEQPIKIPEWVEKGATYDQRRPNQLQKDLLCQNCNELQKHSNFAPITYKYLIQSRENKTKDNHIERREKKKIESQPSIAEEQHKSQQTGEASISTYTIGLNSQILNDNKEIDDLIDQINHNQRGIVEQNDKITIPEIFQIIHPKMTDYTYQSIKDNPKFYSKSFWVCQNCYLKLISYDQLESGCAPQINYKQILSSYYDYKPKPLRKEFIKFQQECFDQFLEENQYQQTIWQRCTKTGYVEEYQNNKKRLFKEKIELKEQANDRKTQQQMQIQKNLSNKRKTEEEQSQQHIKLLREKQKKITDHIDFVIYSAQNQSLNRPSTSCTSFTKPLYPKNYINSTIDIESTIPQANLYKDHRRSESNISLNKQLLLDDNSVFQNYSLKGSNKKQQSQKEDGRYKHNSCHLPANEGSAQNKAKKYLHSIEIHQTDQLKHDQKDQKYQNDKFEVDQIFNQQNISRKEKIHQQNIEENLNPSNNEVQFQNLISPTSHNEQIIFYQPEKKQTPLNSQSYQTKKSQNNIAKLGLQHHVKNHFKDKFNKAPTIQTIVNDSTHIRPLSSDRTASKNTLQETGFLFRSKTPSISNGNRTHYASMFSGSGSHNASLKNNILDQQFKSYLTSPYQSSHYSSKDGSMLQKTLNKQHSRSASNIKNKKNNSHQVLDNSNQIPVNQLSFNQEQLVQKQLELSTHHNPEEQQQYYEKQQQIKDQVSEFKTIENNQQIQDQNKNVNLSKEIEEYGKGEQLENEKQIKSPLNNFKKIRIFQQTNNQSLNQNKSKKQLSKLPAYSSSNPKNHDHSSHIQAFKSFDNNINNQMINNNDKNNLNTKSKKQHLIDQLYQKFHNNRIGMMQKNVQSKHQ